MKKHEFDSVMNSINESDDVKKLQDKLVCDGYLLTSEYWNVVGPKLGFSPISVTDYVRGFIFEKEQCE